MLKLYTLNLLLLCVSCLFAQTERPEDFGFRHFKITYKNDVVDILVKSKKGDEEKKKPLFLFCQGSLPVPLLVTFNKDGKKSIYNVFVFNPDSLANDFHLAIINKPYVPLIADEKRLNPDLTYNDSTGRFPKKYIEHNLLDYYVNRNIAVINYLQRQHWVAGNKLVIAGHSEGSTIAAKIAFTFPKVTQLIYSGGNPCGRIVTMIQQQRARETDTSRLAEKAFAVWKAIIENPNNMDASQGDAFKATYQFSIPPLRYLERLRIPVLITYGTKDYSAPYNDYFRVETIWQKRTNFTFNAYIGLEHNFFPIKPDGETNYDVFNWDKVAKDWRNWLKQQ